MIVPPKCLHPKECHKIANSEPAQVKPQVIPDHIPSFQEVLVVYRKWLDMTPDMEDALKIVLAVALSSGLPGDPLWVFIVSPPGGGKTATLMGMSKSNRTVFQSSITPRTLVSGYKTEDGRDPSLLPLIICKCLIWKDFTEILAMRADDKDEIYAILRGAYDGLVQKQFGNGIRREYQGTFSMVAGVTPAIHGENKTCLGERFLKFNLLQRKDLDPSKQIYAALNNSTKEPMMEKELQNITEAFFNRTISPVNIPKVPGWVKARIVALSQIIAMLRAGVDRDHYQGRIRYRPYAEIGTRLAKQLAKLGQMLAYVQNKTEIDQEVYRLVERVAFDSATGIHLEIVKAIMDLRENATSSEIKITTGLPRSNVRGALEDLCLLGVVKKLIVYRRRTEMGLKSSICWVLSPKMEQLWKEAEVGQPHVKRLLICQKKRPLVHIRKSPVCITRSTNRRIA